MLLELVVPPNCLYFVAKTCLNLNIFKHLRIQTSSRQDRKTPIMKRRDTAKRMILFDLACLKMLRKSVSFKIE